MEKFKNRKSSDNQIDSTSDITNMAGTAIGIGGLGAMSGNTNNQRCPIEDTSFFCRLNRFVATIQLFVTLFVIFIISLYVFYMLYKVFSTWYLKN